MLFYQNFIIAIFGLCIGSFLNVVVYRLPRDQSVVKPRSHCVSCNKTIPWYQNIPVLSFIFLNGKCSNCGAKISWRYPIIELITAALFVLSYRGHLDITQFREWTFVALGIAITFIDLEHRIIPDELSLGGWGFALLTSPWDRMHSWSELIAASLLGFGLFMGFALLYEKFSGRVGLGGGDIKLMGTLGAFLGFRGLWSTILLSSILGSLIGIAYSLIQKQKENAEDGILRAAIPYGPFLILGAFCEFFLGVSKWLNLGP